MGFLSHEHEFNPCMICSSQLGIEHDALVIQPQQVIQSIPG